MKKVYVSWNDVQQQVQELLRQMWQDRWVPDYVVGITRGGLIPANLISQYLGVSMETLKVSLRGEEPDCESNFWMAEDADRGCNILIVDDINDSGDTLNWIRKDWQVDSKWGHNVRVAVLYDNESSASEHTPDYSAQDINKAHDPQWIVFPWESWWSRWNPKEKTNE
jgi:hypoxanthine phosphoribosyltransferase